MANYERKWWVSFFLMAALIVAVFCWLCGCDDNTCPESKLLGPPIVTPAGTATLDIWELGADSFPSAAAFGWAVTYQYETGDNWDQPGMHTVLTAHPILSEAGLEHYILATGANGATEDAATGISGADGITWFFLGLLDWPSDSGVWDYFLPFWHGCGMEVYTDAHTNILFGQTTGHSFWEADGAYGSSWQQPQVPSGTAKSAVSLQNPLVLNPAPSAPKVSVADIPPVLAECAGSVGYPPYNEPNAGGADILVRSRWMKLRLVADKWAMTPIDFITPMPCDSNNVVSVANTAWPYSVCFHAPCQSKGLGVIDAELSIVDPNGSICPAIDIKIHEVGQCVNCTEWLWRSDYVIPLTGPGTGSLSTETPFGAVITIWLPRGYKLKIEPSLNARTIYTLSANWLAPGNILDLNGDGTVNFEDYGALLGRK